MATPLWASRCFAIISRPFPTEESLEDEDVYNNLEDLIEYVWGLLSAGPLLLLIERD